MTEEKLVRYLGIKIEIKQLEEYLRDGVSQLSGTVQTAAEHPYSLHDIPVGGIDTHLYEQCRRQLKINKALKKEIEDFIAAVPDEKVRTAMRCRYMESKTRIPIAWQTVALRCGWQDRRTPQNNIRNYLRDVHQCT